ncbi:MAG: ABC transporter ATP-binding protein [Planctomycetes bacterium]|nr:ABC transporter ATP-binding protein [Planctomycetota bacterium]
MRGTAKRFGPTPALGGVDLEVGAREFLVVLGPTGAGKTTLLRTIAGLETPDSGAIELFGRDAAALAPAERDVALVFQNFSLYPGKSVRANLEFPLRAPGRRLPEGEIAERVAWAAKLLHIERLLERSARALSGGEMQRVAIGRAIVRRPKLFLMDEPLTNLDAKLREELRVELRELARELQTPVVWVTHDQAEALTMGDRIAVLVAGKVLQSGTPEEVYRRPVSPLVARQLGTPPMNAIPARREGGDWVALDGTHLLAAHGAAQNATIGVRPEHVELSGGKSEATVEVVEDLGPARVLVLRWAGTEVHALAPRGESARPGDRVRPRIAAVHAVVWT